MKVTGMLAAVGMWIVAMSASVPSSARVQAQSPVPATAAVPAERALMNRYCVGCHNTRTKTAGLMLDSLDLTSPGEHAETWEKVVRKVRSGMMPPAGASRPERAALDTFAATLETALDREAAARPNPGNPGLHRLNRTEYANALRDLIAVDVDVSTLLPADDSSEGFDNIADALGVSPALVERYTAAAVKISRLAVGNPLASPSTATYRVPLDLAQADHIEGLPLGTRGGTLFRHTFPLDAEYAFKIRIRGAAIGLASPVLGGEELDVTLDGERLKLVPAAGVIDLRLPVKAGPHEVGVTFVRKSPAGADQLWQVFATNSGVQSVAITGPFTPSGSGDTPSRRRIFTCRPAPQASPAEESACAKSIVATLARRAFRQPVGDPDLQTLLAFYQAGRKTGSFDTGVEQALARVLVDPRFVFRLEGEPAGVAANRPFRITDLELASRLSFFLWSSIPDDELLNAAARGTLHEPAVLEKQTRRMLADPRAQALVTNFGGQWLYLRELKNAKPDAREFNDNLRQAFRRETEMLFDSIIREDRSVVDLLDADYTFVNETLARHYGIPNVRGSRFRRVTLTDQARRGLLGQGSFLLVTSVSNRTSPVSRGKWVLENLIGVAPPVPPADVPPLDESANRAASASVRQRLEEHRRNPVCASCHKIMDPIGFSLENFDAIGKWRATDGGQPIDASSQLVDGTRLDGPASLRRALVGRSDVFVRTMAEKLLTYATGRALRYYDMPVVRSIVREAARNDQRFSSIVLGVVKSEPFQMRTKS